MYNMYIASYGPLSQQLHHSPSSSLSSLTCATCTPAAAAVYVHGGNVLCYYESCDYISCIGYTDYRMIKAISWHILPSHSPSSSFFCGACTLSAAAVYMPHGENTSL